MMLRLQTTPRGDSVNSDSPINQEFDNDTNRLMNTSLQIDLLFESGNQVKKQSKSNVSLSLREVSPKNSKSSLSIDTYESPAREIEQGALSNLLMREANLTCKDIKVVKQTKL